MRNPFSANLSNLMNRVITAAGYLGAYLVVVGMLVTTYDVVARYAFNKPTFFAYDISRWIYYYATLLLAPVVLREEAHVRIDIVLIMLKKKVSRAMLETVSSALLVIACAFLLYQGALSTAEDIRTHIITNTSIRIPRFWLFMGIPISAFLLTWQGIVRLKSNFYKLVNILHEKKVENSMRR